VQEIAGVAYAEAALPPCGWRTLSRVPRPPDDSVVQATSRLLENEHLRLIFNERGEISSCLDKESMRELAAAPLNSLRMYKDVPRDWDAWDLESPYKEQPVELPEPTRFELLAVGPLAAVLRITRQLGRSVLEQEVWLRRGSRRVEFRTRVDWREKHRLLKANFPLALHAHEAIHEIQFGHLRRPTHPSRPLDADRFEVSAQRWTALAEEKRGAAVLNDCKYGVSVEGSSINLSLLRAPQAPHATADQGEHRFTYALYIWNGCFADSRVVQEACELNTPAMLLADCAGDGSILQVDAPNIVVETIKPAEDGSPDVVVRLYECSRNATDCTLSTALLFEDAVQTDMLEQALFPLPRRGGGLALAFRPFEIKTVRLRIRRPDSRA
jgi:alpha-mannosidase